MDVIEFKIPAIPVAQPRHRVGVIAGKARAFGAPKSHPIHAFKASARMAAAEVYDGPPLEGALRVDAVFVFPRTQAQTWKRRPMPRLPHTKKPDRDNLDKALLDALSGLLWRDDAQVCDGAVTKVIAAGDEQPHVSVRVLVLENTP